jgi:hypothetical protein
VVWLHGENASIQECTMTRPSVSQFLRDHYVDETPINKEHRMPDTKYDKTVLPTPENALLLAADREMWAREARNLDKHGTARELELTALLLRHYVANPGAST